MIVCNICSKTFTTQRGLKIHESIAHKGTVAEKKFISLPTLAFTTYIEPATQKEYMAVISNKTYHVFDCINDGSVWNEEVTSLLLSPEFNQTFVIVDRQDKVPLSEDCFILEYISKHTWKPLLITQTKPKSFQCEARCKDFDQLIYQGRLHVIGYAFEVGVLNIPDPHHFHNNRLQSKHMVEAQYNERFGAWTVVSE